MFSFLSRSVGKKIKNHQYEKMINLNSQAAGLSLCLQHKTSNPIQVLDVY